MNIAFRLYNMLKNQVYELIGFNREEPLNLVNGDEELLGEIIGLFLENYTEWLDELKKL